MKNYLTGFLLAVAFALVGSIACSQGGVKEQNQIASSCAAINVAGRAITAGYKAGKVSKADLQSALVVVRPTKSFCEPKPAAHLTPEDYAALLNAAADLATRKEAIR